MLNMSEQFYKYIANTIVRYLSHRQLEGGERFSLYMEEVGAVSKLYETIGNIEGFDKVPFAYKHEKGTTSFETYAININDSHLIVVASNDDVREDFITTLRNQVAKQEGDFNKKNLLILFSGRLDSLLGGSEDLTKAGMPLNSRVFRKTLVDSINKKSELKHHEKAILEYSLNKMEEDIASDNHSIFDYQGIVGTINQGTIKTDDYHSLGLFPHKELSSITTPKVLRNNIRENNERFEEIEHVFKHGDSSNDLDRLLSDKGIKELNSADTDQNWKNTDFSDIIKWIDERSKVAPAEFTGKSPYECTLGDSFVFGRPDGNSTSKKRNTNIIIFNPMNIFPVSLSLKFNKRVKKDAIKTDKDERLDISTHGSRINVDVLDKDTNFWRLQYHDDASGKNFQFKILMYKCQPHPLESIKTVFSIQKQKPHYIELNCGDKPYLVFNKGADLENRMVLEEKAIYTVNSDEHLSLKVKDDYELDKVPFHLKIEEDTLSFNFVPEKPKLQPIKGLKVWKDKRELDKSFTYQVSKGKDDKDVVKLTTENEEFTVSGEFRKRLEWEEFIIESNSISWEINVDDKIKEAELQNIPLSLVQAFNELRDFYRKNNRLPSLTPLKDDYLILTKNVVNTFLQCTSKFANKNTTTEALNEIMQVGIVSENHHHKDIHMSPLHPLMLAYQIELHERVGQEKLYDAILAKLTPINLLPIIRWKDNDSIYSPTENSSIPEWVRYNNKKEFKKGISKSFVRKLVKDKISEFQDHFSYLFVNPQSPIVINAFNLGDCKEILQGLFDYYEKALKGLKRIDNLPCIDVNIYGSDKWVTKFEELTFYQNAKELKDKEEELNLKLKTPYNYDSDDLLNTFRKKVHFYTKSIDDVSYAHISFYHFDQMKIQYSDLMMNDVPTGIVLGGLFSDLTSEFSNKSYRTGFSTKGLEENKSILEETAIIYNAMSRVSFSPLLYEKEKSICSSISLDIKDSLENIYGKSQWVTFIEPKVGLNFFKENEKVVIIHYSDQYNNTSGYDAITVTKKTKQYQYVLEEFLKSRSVSLEGEQANTSDIINLFNSINGDWLLKIISQENPNYKNEKLSLLSAIKAVLALFNHPDIVWIPTSLEEVLRVSGNAGLSQKDGLLSAKNLGKSGSFSDDLLLIGLEKIGKKLKMYLYPIEVKIGENNASIVKKAKEQGLKTAELIQDLFKVNDDEESSNLFKVGLYKNFFAKIALVTTEKLKLYNVWSNNDAKWDKVLSDYRKELLNNEFEIGRLENLIGEYGVFLFSNSNIRRKLELDDKFLCASFLKEDGYNFLTKGIDDVISVMNMSRIQLPLEGLNILNNVPNKVVEEKITKKDNLIASDISSETTINTTLESSNTPLEDSSKNPIVISFDRINQSEREQMYTELYEMLVSHKIAIKRVLPKDINFQEAPSFYKIQLEPDRGFRFPKINSIIQEINMSLKLPQGKSARITQDLGQVWLEIPKTDAQKVTITTEHIWSKFKQDENFRVPFAIDIDGKVASINFSSTKSPHLLIAGQTGSGKSVTLDTIIRSATRYYTANELELFLIDPKGNELVDFEDLPHVSGENGETPEDAIELLKEAAEEMDARYKRFKEFKKVSGKAAKDIIDFNTRSNIKMKRWLIILDEYADLIEQDRDQRREIESLLKRLSSKARASGIHLILATQKPTVEVVSSTIKANLPGLIALKVKTSSDSRVVLDESGAETLGGNGDAFYKTTEEKLLRVQCAWHKG